MRRLIALAASVAAVATLTLTGCGTTTSSPTASGPASSAGDPHRKVIKVTFANGTVSPIAETLSVSVGDQIVLDIYADAPGEIHVHSTPEQHVDYAKGHSQHPIATSSFPTVIDVESHSLEKTILILQVH